MAVIISQKDLFPKLIKLDNCNRTFEYPVGSCMAPLIDYSISAANKLAELFPKEKIALIVRGTSGAMVGGLIASHLIKALKVHSRVIISRKPEEVSHTHGLEGLGAVLDSKEVTPFRLVVADDFISSGETVYNIVSDVESYIGQPFVFDALAVHSRLIYNLSNKSGNPGDLILRGVDTPARDTLLTKFLNILCL